MLYFMQNATFVWPSIDLMCNLSYKVFTDWKITGFTFSPRKKMLIKFSHIYRHAILYGEYHYCVTVYQSDTYGFNFSPPNSFAFIKFYWSDSQSELQSYNFDSYEFYFPPPNSFAFIKFKFTDLETRLFKMMYLHAWSKAKLISWALNFHWIIRSSN